MVDRPKLFILPSEPTGPKKKQGLVGQVIIIQGGEVIYTNLEPGALTSALLVIGRSPDRKMKKKKTEIVGRSPTVPTLITNEDDPPEEIQDFRNWNG